MKKLKINYLDSTTENTIRFIRDKIDPETSVILDEALITIIKRAYDNGYRHGENNGYKNGYNDNNDYRDND